MDGPTIYLVMQTVFAWGAVSTARGTWRIARVLERFARRADV